uniref:Ig-like domain-containing protein n=1 Tax=Cyprinus carpio TaxID=7962 RepID=A0A8C2DK14_CYPCA
MLYINVTIKLYKFSKGLFYLFVWFTLYFKIQLSLLTNHLLALIILLSFCLFKVSKVVVKFSCWVGILFACIKRHVALFSFAFHVPSAFSCMLPAPPPDVRATVYLTAPTKMDLENETATFMCLAQRFSPKLYTFKWSLDDKEVKETIESYDKSEKKGSVTEYSATSILQIKAEAWKKQTSKVKCEFVHKAGNEEREAEYAGKKPKKPTVFVLAPPEHKKGEPMTLTCYVKDFYPKEVFVSWLADDEPVTSKYSTSLPIQKDQTFSVYSQLTVNDSKWTNGTVFSCVVYHEAIDEKMRVLTRSITDNIEKAGVINLSMNTPWRCSVIVWLEHPLYEASDTDDSGIANTAITFVFLFLITLFYSIGATFVKVYIFYFIYFFYS